MNENLKSLIALIKQAQAHLHTEGTEYVLSFSESGIHATPQLFSKVKNEMKLKPVFSEIPNSDSIHAEIEFDGIKICAVFTD